ncbi:phosphopantetheine-binding protein [Persicobacter psychrovividus]|uniref:Acyl carrier protein n=1 Tax=Persicobacter psychrovividus TaxID=387638 RepID=A0ABN6LG42_9BACT|nr:hypothetical protein PEPS_44200 [Persicobacter psychrovividus]
MEKTELIEKINIFLIEEFEVEGELNADESLMEALDLDSLDLVDLVVVIEKKFGFKVKSEDFEGIRTLNDFYDYVYQRTQHNS